MHDKYSLLEIRMRSDDGPVGKFEDLSKRYGRLIRYYELKEVFTLKNSL